MSQERITRLEHAREMRDLYYAAEKAVLLNQSYSIAGQTLTRANLMEIRKGRQEWETVIDTLIGRSRRSIRRVVPVDW